jgi:hypothetical protein
MPRNGGIGDMIAGRPCGELAVALFITTVHFVSEDAQSPLRGVSEVTSLGGGSKKSGGLKHGQEDGDGGHLQDVSMSITC